MKGRYELAILGAGPAGLIAGVYAGRKLLNTCIVVREISGQIMLTSKVENYI